MARLQNQVLAAEQRQMVAHGVSRGFGADKSKPRRGDRWNVSNGFSFRPFRACSFIHLSHGSRRGLSSAAPLVLRACLKMCFGEETDSDGVRPSSGAATWHCESHWRNRERLLVEHCCGRGRPHSERWLFRQALINTVALARWKSGRQLSSAVSTAFRTGDEAVETAELFCGRCSPG